MKGHLIPHCLPSSALVTQVPLEELLDPFPQVELSLGVRFWLPAEHHSAPHSRVKPRGTVRRVRGFQKVTCLRIDDQLEGLFAVLSQRRRGLLGEKGAVPVVVVSGRSKQEVAGGTLNWNQGRPVLA